ncbi:MAG: serine/threonine protein kinase, partial [Conexibacter sp.]
TGTTPGGGSGSLQQIGLRADAASDYDPLGDGTEHANETAFAIDNTATTTWSTESYTTGDLQKAGVGIAIDLSPATVVRQLRIHTPTPGFAAEVYVSDAPPPDALPDPAWKLVATVPDVEAHQTVALDTAGQTSRTVLLWITALPSGGDQVEISELSLYR